MKKLFIGCLAFLCSTMTWADNAFSIDDFTIAAGEEKEIEVKMFNDVAITAFQFNVALPEGVSIKYDEDEEAYCVSRTSRLLSTHVLSCELQQSGDYKIMVYHNTNKNLKGNSGDAVVTITLVASDQISTNAFTPAITKQEMTATDGTTTTKYKINDASYNCSVTLSTTVTTLGYASFSWPKALDFTNSGLTAYIATSCDGSSVHLEQVTKVPANTGLILKGTAGSENTYSLSTTTDATLDDVSGNLLSSNTEGQYTVASDNIYVLSNLDDGTPGFYIAAEGIHVAQYKSYLVYGSSGARKTITIDKETAGINNVFETDVNREYYNLQGQRVSKPTKGIYIAGGKKYIVKQ